MKTQWRRRLAGVVEFVTTPCHRRDAGATVLLPDRQRAVQARRLNVMVVVIILFLSASAAAQDSLTGAADAARAAGRFDQALVLYQKAMEGNPPRRTKLRIIAGSVRCYQALDRPERVGEAFLLLVRDDPQTPQFDCIPLAWLPRRPSVSLEQTAGKWLGRTEPAAQLLGASYLLTTGERSKAMATLRRLAVGPDRRVAQLAMAQTWRATLTTADDEQLDAIEQTIRRMPERFAAGPYFVLGRAYLQRQQWEKAALALLRVPILYPQQRPLAAQSLADAGRAMEQLGRTDRAVRLYRELIREYPEQTRPVAEVKGRGKREGGGGKWE